MQIQIIQVRLQCNTVPVYKLGLYFYLYFYRYQKRFPKSDRKQTEKTVSDLYHPNHEAALTFPVGIQTIGQLEEMDHNQNEKSVLKKYFMQLGPVLC